MTRSTLPLLRRAAASFCSRLPVPLAIIVAIVAAISSSTHGG